MSYTPNVSMYYYKPGQTASNRFIPVPLISVQPEMIYANDTVIGHTYNVTLEGYATALNLSTYTEGDKLTFNDTLVAVQQVRDILSCNGNTLEVVDGSGPIIVASGGILQSLSFNETDNNWFNYAKYTATLSFQDIAFGKCDGLNLIGCGSLPLGVAQANSPYFLDMTKHKVKSMSENLAIDASNIYTDNEIAINNEFLNLTYTVNATGKHYIVADKVLPAWQQAKNYCKDRLIQQVQSLQSRQIGPLTSTSQSSTCTSSTTSANFDNPSSVSLLYRLPAGDYNIYNETVDCSTSEAEGSFSLTYKCILKRKASDNALFANTHCFHRITTNRSISDDGTKRDVTEEITGEIEGLIQGGLITNPDILELPNNGYLLKTNANPTETKYANALAAYNKIINVSNNSPELKSELVKTLLSITNSSLDPSLPNGSSKPNKLSHVATHNYNTGIISYTENYNNNQNSVFESGVCISNVKVNVEFPIATRAEFIVPGRANGPIYQLFPATSSKKIVVSMDGRCEPDCSNNFSEAVINDYCNSIIYPTGVPPTGLLEYEITDNSINLNWSDGSFTVNRSYTYIDNA